MRRKLQERFITVSKIDPLKYVIVSANSSITETTLKTYFQSPESHGGEVLRVAVGKDGCYKVKFRREEGLSRNIKYKTNSYKCTVFFLRHLQVQVGWWFVYSSSQVKVL